MNGRRTIGAMPRKPAPRLRRSRRDLLVLRVGSKLRVFRNLEVVPLLFPSLVVATRRLRRLLDAGLLTCTVEALHESNRYALSGKGARLLENEAGAEPTPPTTTRRGPHHFVLTRFWSLLAHACHTTQSTRLVRFSFEWELTPAHLPTLTSYRPDALFVVRAGPVEHGVVLEADRGTEPPSTVALKVTAACRLIATHSPIAGVVVHQLLILVPSERRARAIAKAVGHGGSAPVLLRVFGDQTASFALHEPWWTIADLLADADASGALLPEASS